MGQSGGCINPAPLSLAWNRTGKTCPGVTYEQ